MKTYFIKCYLFSIVLCLVLHSCNTDKSFTKDQIPEMKSDIAFLSSDEMEGRLVGSKGEKLAADYIIKRYKELGLTALDSSKSYLQKFEVTPRLNPHSMIKDTATITGNNVVGFIDNNSMKTIIIGAHYDHLGYGEMGGSLYRGSEKEVHNGADDNASGIAAMFALAERIQYLELNTYNFMFLAFSGEEQGLWGSNYYSKNPLVANQDVAFMINMDMVGRLDDKKRVAIHGTGTSPLWNEIIDSIKVPAFEIKKHASGVGPSDHTSFYLQDIPVLHFFTGQHEDYHKPTDDAHLINYEGLDLIVDYIEQVLKITDGSLPPIFTKTKDESRQAPAFKVTLGVVPDYLYNKKGMRIDGINEGGPAFNAKLQKGDIVIKMGALEIVDMMSYMKALSIFEKGETIAIEVERDGQIVKKDLTF